MRISVAGRTGTSGRVTMRRLSSTRRSAWRSIDRPFIVLTETKPSKRHIPVWARYSPLAKEVNRAGQGDYRRPSSPHAGHGDCKGGRPGGGPRSCRASMMPAWRGDWRGRCRWCAMANLLCRALSLARREVHAISCVCVSEGRAGTSALAT